MESRAERRMSLWRGRRESVWGGRRESLWGGRRESLWRGHEEEDSAQAGFRPKLANTYRLEPLHPFAPHLLRRGAEELLGAFGDLQYQQDSCRRLACRVADQLLALAKEQVFERYRYVVQVSVGQKLGQGVKIASKALWDHEKDSFITLRYENPYLFAVGTVFALYMD
ncbi:tctex1 domain-containing protein 3 [Colossoma macropomum]|uniref:tctex1 domain-containing protein 3 n=1 Tax=Colossoma macropomum TaxID=42526 RepID=UPI00186523EC|nr:tctex1 domain-containing protein 3 [Colossoma macropomum]